MVQVRDSIIKISRGDSGWLIFKISELEDQDNVSLLFTAKKSEADTTPVWVKSLAVEDGKVTLRINSSDMQLPAGAYQYKGSVAAVSALPSESNAVGDIYNVDVDGMNYAWTGSTWDALGGAFAIDAIINAEIDTILAA
ncbi:MAG: hypothetical protein GX096_01585 [Clostridiales bacterium]|nr:hypothetical protein [Clostridiales bacterium]